MSSHVGLLLPIFKVFVQQHFLRQNSEAKAFTPSTLSTILLCAAKDKSHDYATIYAALRRHLSTSPTDRHYNESHTWELESIENRVTFRDVREPFYFSLYCVQHASLPILISM